MSKVQYRLENEVAELTLSDPSTLNAAGLDMVEDLMAALRRATREARAILITGEGKGFCSGANLKSDLPGKVVAAADGDIGIMVETHYTPLANLLRNSPVPVVTAVNGAAVGVGCSIALCGDLIVAADNACFIQAFRHVAALPDGGSSYLLPRAISRARAMEMMLLDDRISADTALEWGMINRCVPLAELIPTARELASRLATGPHSLSLIRKLAWESPDHSWHEQLARERELMTLAGRSDDYREAGAARTEGRTPRFTGR